MLNNLELSEIDVFSRDFQKLNQCSILKPSQFETSQHPIVEADIISIAEDIYNGIANIALAIANIIGKVIIALYDASIYAAEAIGTAL